MNSLRVSLVGCIMTHVLSTSKLTVFKAASFTSIHKLTIGFTPSLFAVNEEGWSSVIDNLGLTLQKGHRGQMGTVFRPEGTFTVRSPGLR